ncbi:MAG: hypothetical protein WBW33_37505 [Bryobacteraceae bacterium]
MMPELEPEYDPAITRELLNSLDPTPLYYFRVMDLLRRADEALLQSISEALDGE